MTTEVDVLNACLARIGESPLESRDDPAGFAAWSIYDSSVAVILGSYPWTFLRATKPLTRVAAVPGQHWAYAYQLPADMSGNPRAAYDQPQVNVPFTAWEREGDKLLTNAVAVWLRYTRKANPDAWPPLVTECIKIAVMAELALSVREDSRLRELLRGQVFGTPSEAGSGGLLATARNQDSQSEPSVQLAQGSNPLIDCRY